MAAVRLSDAVRACGFHLVRCARPGSHPDRLGQQSAGTSAAVLRRRRIAVVSDTWDLAYVVSHEIAELVHGFRHSETLFMFQANVLAAWHRMRSGMRPAPWLRVGPIDDDEAHARALKAGKQRRARRLQRRARG